MNFKQYLEEQSKNSDTIAWLYKTLSKKDAEITIKKNNKGDSIVYVNGQTSFNLSDVNGAIKSPKTALKRAYDASLKKENTNEI